MPKMQVNEDTGTVTIPVKGRDPVVLDELTLDELGWLTEQTAAIDATLPVLPPLPVVANLAEATQEQRDAIEAYNVASRDREKAIYEGERPYAKLLVEAIKQFTGDSVDGTQLYGWAASPVVMRTLIGHFRSPLPGRE